MLYLCFLYALFAIVIIMSLDVLNSYMSNKFSRHYEVYGLIMTCALLCVLSAFFIDDELR